VEPALHLLTYKKQLATENTEITEEKQKLATRELFTLSVKLNMWINQVSLCVLCDLCGLNWFSGLIKK
jgi:hypothetical protein